MNGTLMTVIGVFVMASAFAGGWVSDRLGSRRVVAFSGLFSGAGACLILGTVWMPNLTLIYIAGIIFGVGTGLFMTANWALGTELIPADEAGRYLGISNLAGAGAGMIGKGIGGPMADYLNGLPSRAGVLRHLRRVRPPVLPEHGEPPRHPEGESMSATPVAAAADRARARDRYLPLVLLHQPASPNGLPHPRGVRARGRGGDLQGGRRARAARVLDPCRAARRPRPSSSCTVMAGVSTPISIALPPSTRPGSPCSCSTSGPTARAAGGSLPSGTSSAATSWERWPTCEAAGHRGSGFSASRTAGSHRWWLHRCAPRCAPW